MPTYEYECKKCGHTFEVFQAMSEEPLKKCTKCGKEVRRIICGGAGVIFKGSGFYVTDKAGGKTSTKTETKKSETSTAPEGTAAAGSAAPCTNAAACKNAAVCGAANASGGRTTKPPAQSA